MAFPGETRGGKPKSGPGIRVLAVAVCIAAAILGMGLALAEGLPSPRGADHDGFGRMVFDWGQPVQWSADVVNNELILRFDHAVQGDPKSLVKPLAHYLRGVTASPDRRMLTFPLAVPVQIKSFVTGSSTVVDLTEAKTRTQSVAQPAASAPSLPSTPAALIDLMVRGGEHPGFNRLVFDWPGPVDYSVDLKGTQVTLTFDRAARVNPTALAASLPTDVGVVSAGPKDKSTVVVLALPVGMRVRHFTSGPRVAVDLVRPAGSEPPPRAAGAPMPTLAPAPGAEAQPDTLTPLASATLPPPAAPPPQPSQAAPTQAAAAPQPPAPVPAAAPPAVDLPSAGEGGGLGDRPPGATVAISFDQPAAAAAFRRAGWLWLVFDRKTTIDPAGLVRTGNGIVLAAERVPSKTGTALRLLTRRGFSPVPARDGNVWSFDLYEEAPKPLQPLIGQKQFDFESRGRLLLSKLLPAKEAVILVDPEVGDLIHVMPSSTVGAGLADERHFPGFDLLASVQGVAMVPRMEGVWLDPTHGNVQVTMPGGIMMSRDLVAAPAPGEGKATSDRHVVVQEPTSPSGLIDIPRWLRGGLDKFEGMHQLLLGRVAAADPKNRRGPRLEVARHYLANSMAADALGVLKAAALSDPAFADTNEFKAVRGAANVLMVRDAEAIADLSQPGLVNDRQVALWLSTAKARSGELGLEALVLKRAADEMDGWPPRLRIEIGRVAIEAEIAVGDAKAANRIVEAIGGAASSANAPVGFNKYDQAGLTYLQGLVAEALHDYDKAEAKYQEVEDGPSRPDRAFAMRHHIEMDLARQKISIDDAIHRMERLRFAWRDPQFEYENLKRLGELLVAAGRYGDGLRAFRALIQNLPDNPDIPNVSRMMSAVFERLYLGGEADKLQPITAIGLFDEFQELTPSGDKGDEMIRRLADRLASVDLLDRASALLDAQVRTRLSGVEKARVGARLAFLQVANRQSQAALDTLETTEVADEPPALYDQRRYLRIRVLANLGRDAEALALLVNDQSPDARALRAEIYWEMKKWPEAAVAIEANIERPPAGKPLDAATAQRVLDLATAMTLARDERGLERIRRVFGPQMAATNLKDGFDLLTSAPEHGIVDFRRIGDKIKQAEDFQTFMGQWQKRVRSNGLSSIN